MDGVQQAAWNLAVALHSLACGEILGVLDNSITPEQVVLGDREQARFAVAETAPVLTPHYPSLMAAVRRGVNGDVELLRDCVERLTAISGGSLPLPSPPQAP